jgi:hypothetical protein|tara:strand:- start:25 stop:630 length:606 start_codon:yes stop_codon:yes gene_type:complete
VPFIHEHNLLFVHIPKCGGSSVIKKFNIDDNSLNSCYRHEEKFDYCDENEKDILFSPQHFTPSVIKRYYSGFFDLYKKFTIIRNPYTRSISEYLFREKNIKEFNDFDFFIWWEKFLLSECDHLLPQNLYFKEIDYDSVLKYESLEKDFNDMCDMLKIPKGLPHINKSHLDSSSCVTLLSKRTKDFLYEIYRDDFTEFGYKS